MGEPAETDDEPMLVRISSLSGRVAVVAEERADVSVSGEATVDHEDQRVTVSATSSKLEVRVPHGTDLVIGAASGRVRVKGPVGDVAVTTESGRIDIEAAESVDARTSSAKIIVGSAANRCRLKTKSGTIKVGSCCDAVATTTSGRITIDAASGPVHAHCVSGRIDVGLSEAQDVDAETVSGRINISLPSGVRAHHASHRAVGNEPPPGCDCTIAARSVSGRVNITNR
jgi:DUF4097 and DUF4098 domain-containing protein YvlB